MFMIAEYVIELDKTFHIYRTSQNVVELDKTFHTNHPALKNIILMV